MRIAQIGPAKQKQIAAAVKRASRALAPDVVSVQYRFGEDWTGDPSIYFGVILSDHVVSQELGEISRRVQDTVEDEVDVEELGLQSYFRFRSNLNRPK